MSGPSELSFEVIERGAVKQDLRIRDSDVSVAGGAVRHAIDRSGRRHLLIPLTDDQAAAEDHGSCGVSLSGRELVDANRSERYLDVACEAADLRDLFAVFCDDLLHRLATEAAHPAAVSSAELGRWRALFNPVRGALLGSDALAGLLAELHLLEQLACRAPGQAVRLWTGPDKARVDFTGASAGIEVKATTGRDRVTAAIHGLRQLDEAGLDDLYLYVEQLEPTRIGGDSVPDAIARLLSAGVDGPALLTSLADVGYQQSDSRSYRLVRFEVRSCRTFMVTAPGFPRLVPAALTDPGLADRLFRVSYTIDVTDAEALPGHLATIEPAIERLLRGTAC
jgi:hypothetical protein